MRLKSRSFLQKLQEGGQEDRARETNLSMLWEP